MVTAITWMGGCSRAPVEPTQQGQAEDAARVTPAEPAVELPLPEPDPKPAAEEESMQSILATRAEDRERMVREDLVGVRDPRVLDAMRAVPREEFVPDRLREFAYDDGPLPIGYEVTISQPAVVARMTELARVGPGDRVLEVGTGSGYQAAVLDALGVDVFSIEIIAPLAAEAKERLARLGYHRVTVRYGDGYAGWPDEAPFDAIIVTAAPPSIPEPLKEQLVIGGRLVVPVGRDWQDLVVVTRTESGYQVQNVLPVRFVPMTGEAQRRG